MTKKILAILLTFAIVFCLVFECSLTSSAVIGVDDAILIGAVCVDLLALGITLHGVSDFAKSEAFNDFCASIGNDIDTGISLVKRNGVLFFATARQAWSQICSWVKSKFSGRNETVQIEFETTQSGTPSSLTLTDGTSVPYAEWMQYPFFIYRSGGLVKAIYCTGQEVGMTMAPSLVQVLCVGYGTLSRYDLVNGSWSHNWTVNMTYGASYKGKTGSLYNLSFSGVDASSDSFYLYRTIERTTTSGTSLETAPPQSVPDVEESTTATVTATSDPVYYPGAVDSPAEVIQQGEQILIRVPEEIVVDGNTSNPSITTDIDTIGQTLAGLTPSDVKPQVLTQTASLGATVDEIIADTPEAEIPGNAESDIETANKFILPRSFLEGFPFSIPYSIYLGLQTFIADPEAPHFELPFSIPRLGIEEKVDLDLAQFNPLARVCRAFLSLVWVAGLAMAVNAWIKR